MSKGKYILVEGGDGSGKSTQIKLLEDYLGKKKIPFVRTREPGGTEICDIYRDIVLTRRKEELSHQAELFTYLAARSQVIFHVVKPALERGEWVISDRGYPSTVAYQGHGMGISKSLINELNEFSVTFKDEEILPDLVFIIDVPAEVGLAKATEHGADRQESRGIEFHKRVINGYRQIISHDKKVIPVPYIEDGIMKMHNQIVQTLEQRFF